MYSEKLIEIRESYNLYQKDLEPILNINRSVIGRYEREADVFPIEHLNTLCNYYNTSFDYIFSFSDKFDYVNSRLNIDLELSGRRLKQLRRDNNLTQQNFGELCGVDGSMISNYENGKYPISTVYLYGICDKYKISADYLLGKIDYPKSFK